VAPVPDRLLVEAPVVDRSAVPHPARRGQRPIPSGARWRSPAPRRRPITPRGVAPAAEGVGRARPPEVSWPRTTTITRSTATAIIAGTTIVSRATTITRATRTTIVTGAGVGSPTAGPASARRWHAPTTTAARRRVGRPGAEPHQGEPYGTRQGNSRYGRLQVHRVTPAPGVLLQISPTTGR
jgi:hypothetical protein